MKRPKTIGFVPNALDKLMLADIQEDCKKEKSELIRHIIRGYYKLYYGEENYKDIKNEMIQSMLGDDEY